MKIILKNTNVEFKTSKTLAKVSVQDGYMNPTTGEIYSSSTYSCIKYDVSKLKKVRVVCNVGSSTLPLGCVILKKTGVVTPIISISTSTSAFDQIIDVIDCEELYVNSSQAEAENATCQIVEFDTIDGEEIDGTMVSGILNADGSIGTNQYYVVGKYNVSDYKYVNVYSTNNAIRPAYALKSNGSTIAVVKSNYVVKTREAFLVDVRDADEIWVGGLVNPGITSCYAVR